MDISNKIELIKTEKLIPYHNNPKEHPPDQIDKIASSIKNYGFVQPLVIDSENEIIIGHGRLEAAKKLELKEVPVVVKDDLTDAQVKALRIADNKVAESEWDMEMLSLELEDLEEFTGFDEDELDEMLNEMESEEDMFDLEDELNEEESITEKGDIIKLGGHRLMCGDSTKDKDVEKLMNGNKADMVFTDPPYGLGGYGGRNNMELKGDDHEDIKKFYNTVSLDIPEIYIWGNYKNLMHHLDKEPRDVIVWKKNNFGLGKGYRGQYELCFYYGSFDGSDSDVWEVDKDINYEHPTQKPIVLAGRAIKNSSNNNDIVLDLFGGSGSTLIAAEQLNRTCYMMELDEHYCDVIIRRYINYKQKKNENINIKVNEKEVSYKKYLVD